MQTKRVQYQESSCHTQGLAGSQNILVLSCAVVYRYLEGVLKTNENDYY